MNDQRVVSPFLPLSDAVPPFTQISQPYPVEAFSSSPSSSSPASPTAATNMSGKLSVQGSTGGLFGGSTVERRGGPMDMDNPTQGIHPSVSSMQPQQQSSQQHQIYDPCQLMPPLQPLHSNQSGQSSSQQSFHSADSTLSDHSNNNTDNTDNNYYYYSQHPLHQSYHPSTLSPNALPLPSPTTTTTSSSLTSALGQLQAPLPTATAFATASATATTSAAAAASAEKSRSRRWSLTGRFFEKRKSITEPFHIPNSHPQQQSLQASYNSATNRNVVFGSGAGSGDGSNGGSGDSSVNINNTDNSITIDSHIINSNNSNNNNVKQGSPPDNDSGSRRSSIVDIPKAFLSSLRRGPLAGSNDSIVNSINSGNSSGCAATSAISEANEDAIDAHQMMDPGFIARNAWLGGRPHITMAVPRAPPQDASALANRPPPKSILKKRPSDMNVDASAGGFVASAAIAGAGPGPNHSNNGKNGSKTTGGAAVNATRDMEVHEPTPISGVGSRRPSALESEDIHPMATPDMDPEEIKLLTPPTDHRARLTTHSPTPSHPQQQGLGTLSSTSSSLALKNTRKSGGGIGKAIGASVQMPVGGAGSPQKRNNDGSTSNTTMDMNKKRDPNQQQQHDSYNSSAGAAIPPDFTPGVQSNLHKDRGGERPQGDVGGQDITQDEMLTQQMFSLSSRAQDLVSQYYGLDDVGGSLQAPGATAVTAAAAGSGETRGPRQRRINFLDMIEIIPAHRKSDYNRSSDKHATFRVLTPDLKSEIRDELNTYKMREMAVHVESMANTAFH